MFIHSYCCYASANSSPYTASLYKPALTEKSRRLLWHQPDMHTYRNTTFAPKFLIHLSLQIHCPRLTLRRTPQTSKCPKKIENNLIEIQAFIIFSAKSDLGKSRCLLQAWMAGEDSAGPWSSPRHTGGEPAQAQCPEAATLGTAPRGQRESVWPACSGGCVHGAATPVPSALPLPNQLSGPFPAAVSVTL